jgi:4-amino-4-deoxy-L-arabinose transferase-like glycosyltransferase
MKIASKIRGVLPGCIVVGALLLAYVPHILSHNVRSHDFLKGDCYYYKTMIVSMLEDGDLVMSNNIGKGIDPLNGFLALGKDDDLEQLVPKHPILLPVVSLPFYAVLGSVGLLLFNLLVIVAVFLVMYGILRLFYDTWIAVATSVLFGVATLFLNYSYNYSPDAFSTLIFLAGLYCAFLRRHGAAGLLLGLAIFAKLPNLPLVIVVTGYVAWDLLLRAEPGRRGHGMGRFALFVLCLGVALIPLAWSNQALYGAPWIFGYHREITAAGLDDHVGNFNQPFVRGFVRLLIDGEHGLLTTNPILLVSGVGLACLWRRSGRAELVVIGLLCLAQLAFFASYDEWNHSHFSNRFLMTTVALSSVFAAAVLERVVRVFAPPME